MNPRYETITSRDAPMVTIDHWQEVPLEALKAALNDDARKVAEKKILAILPEYMQRNLTARAAELAVTHAGLHSDQFPEPDRSEWAAGQALWNRIKAIRNASNVIGEEINAATTLDQIEAIDAGLKTSQHWPE